MKREPNLKVQQYFKTMYKATAYLKPIRMWAQSEGMPFFTWKEIRRALTLYEIFQASKN